MNIIQQKIDDYCSLHDTFCVLVFDFSLMTLEKKEIIKRYIQIITQKDKLPVLTLDTSRYEKEIIELFNSSEPMLVYTLNGNVEDKIRVNEQFFENCKELGNL